MIQAAQGHAGAKADRSSQGLALEVDVDLVGDSPDVGMVLAVDECGGSRAAELEHAANVVDDVVAQRSDDDRVGPRHELAEIGRCRAREVERQHRHLRIGRAAAVVARVLRILDDVVRAEQRDQPVIERVLRDSLVRALRERGAARTDRKTPLDPAGDVSVVVVAYRTPDVLAECLRSFEEQRPSRVGEVVVVDNSVEVEGQPPSRGVPVDRLRAERREPPLSRRREPGSAARAPALRPAPQPGHVSHGLRLDREARRDARRRPERRFRRPEAARRRRAARAAG